MSVGNISIGTLNVSQPIHNFLSNVYRQTNQHYQKHTLAPALSLDQSGLQQLDNMH